MNNCTAGIDVSKSQFDLAISGSRSVQRFDSGPDGREKLIRRLKAARVDLVVLEATGGYERVIMLELMSAGLTVVRINPRQVRNFARARGRLAKTDAIDALTLVEYGEVMKPPVRQLPDADLIALRDLLARRQQLVDMQSMESCRRRQTLEMAAKSSIAAVLAFLKDEQSAIEKLLDERMAQNDEWMAHAAVLREESGVGPATVRTLILELPELGRVSRQEIAAIVGVAPMNRDSGQKRGTRSICGGRASVRSCLYMATLVATKHNPKIRECYHRLQATGKCKKVALVACMRKLLVILNARSRDYLQRRFDQALLSPSLRRPHEAGAVT